MSARRFPGIVAAIAVVASLLPAAPTALAQTFSDVPSTNYYAPFIEKLAQWGVVHGQSGMYRPNDALTRAELTKIAILAGDIQQNASGTPTFWDVPSSHSLHSYVETAARGGIVSGFGGGMFRPDQAITRGEAAKVVFGTQGIPANTSGGPRFWDVPTGHSFYVHVESLFNRGVVSLAQGTEFRVDQSITRAEMAEMVVKAKESTSVTPPTTATGGLTDAQTSACIKERIETVRSTAANVVVQAYTSGERAANNQPLGVVVKITDTQGVPVPGIQLRMEVTEGTSGNVNQFTEVGRTGVYLGTYTADTSYGTSVSPKVTLLVSEQSNSNRQTGYEHVGQLPPVYLSFDLLQSTNIGSVSKICWDLTRRAITIDPNSSSQTLDNTIVVIGIAEDGNGVGVHSGLNMQLHVSGDNAGSITSSQAAGGVYAFTFQPSNSSSNNTVIVKRLSSLMVQLVTQYRVFSSDQMEVEVTYLPRD